jgi:hypothetical protein
MCKSAFILLEPSGPVMGLLYLFTGSSAPTESSQLEPHVNTTPSLVKSVSWLLVNLIAISPGDSLRHINGVGLIRLLLR